MLAPVDLTVTTFHCPNFIALTSAILHTYHVAEQQCVRKTEFDSVVTQMAAQTAAVESELNTWQNATIHILKRFLLENPGKEIEICYKQS